MTAPDIINQLKDIANPTKAKQLTRYFKSSKGEYGEGDKFLGISLPEIRHIAKQFYQVDFSELSKLLDSEYHEVRMCAAQILIEKYKKNRDQAVKKVIVDFYLDHVHCFNNWDLVDATCYNILGNYLIKQEDRSVLYHLADSGHLWSERIAIVSTMAFLRVGQFDDTFKLAKRLLQHTHDLMHKAVGWLLKEAGKKDRNRLNHFLDKHAKEMPRTILRIAIEKHTQEEKKHRI